MLHLKLCMNTQRTTYMATCKLYWRNCPYILWNVIVNIDAVTARLYLRIFLSKIIGISPKYRCEYWEDSDLGWSAKPHRNNVMTK